MQIDPAFIRDETEHWRLNHHLAQTLTDGALLTLFVWRQAGKNPTPPGFRAIRLAGLSSGYARPFKPGCNPLRASGLARSPP
ncbi:hypothetical protein ACMSI6_25900 [Pseudomonas antarctica]|uniref:hypothetical protein n=1 Tax=Pseudomonas antarctica TaxID=219572 RepID=UPI0039C4CA1B